MKFKFTFLLLFITLISFSQNGTVSGVVSDKDLKGEALPFANVTIKGTSFGATTDINGKYAIDVPEGNYTIVFSFLGYESKSVPFAIKANEKKTINETIGSGSVTMEDVVVKASVSREKETALLLDQKKAVEIKQSIGAQEMSRKGVSDVEEGLTKITGITKVDGRGLFVRGLEDRYNNLLINDLAVPSNNPFKKIIPLDLFPTDIVSIIETYKTFNTNLYGDFAGGTFDIITAKDGKSQTKVNFGTGFTTGNNLSNFLLSKDASSTGDFFGFSGNERDKPEAMNGKPKSHTFTTDEALNGFGSGYDVEETKSPLNTSFGFLNTEKFNVGKNGNTFQYLLSLNYDNKYSVREGVDRIFNVGAGNYDNNLFTTQYKFSTNTSAIAALNFKSKRLNLTSSTFYLKTAENMVQDQLGSTNGTTINTNAFIRLNQLQQSTYLTSQLFGNYKLTENERHNLKAGISYTKTAFEMPDRKSFKGVKLDDGTTSISYTGNSLLRQYFDFDGKFYASGMLEYTWNFGNQEIEKSHKLTLGYNGYMNKMTSDIRFLVSQNRASNSVTFPTNNPDAVLANEIQNGNFTYIEGTNSTYKAKLQEFVNAGYFDLAFKFGERFDLNIGARMEQTNRETKYRETGSFDNPYITNTVEKIDFLPSLNTKYKLNDNSNLRLATSKTITRPVVMESFPSAEFVNPDSTIERGNPDLINSDNYNLDLKYELFPSNKELIVVSAFTKYLQNPIERIFKPSAGSGGQIISYDNSKKALLYGAELEFLFQLDRISDNFKDFSFGFNTSLMYSKVTIDEKKNASETVNQNADKSRKLQGASPWLVNADFKYEFELNPNWKNTMTLVYNIYGKRIYAVGTEGLDHFYENSFGKLDFIWGNKLGSNWDVKFSADNILNPLYKIEMGNESKINITEKDLTIKSYKKGVGFSLNLTYTF